MGIYWQDITRLWSLQLRMLFVFMQGEYIMQFSSIRTPICLHLTLFNFVCNLSLFFFSIHFHLFPPFLYFIIATFISLFFRTFSFVFSFTSAVLNFCTAINYTLGSSRINPGAVFLRIFTVAFLLFLAPKGGSNTARPIS